MEEFLTAKEAGEVSGFSKSTIMRRIKSGELKGRKDDDGIWTVLRKDLDEYRGCTPGADEKLVEETAETNPSRFIMNDHIPGY